ncbi:hypothetical protein A6M27_16745 [Acidithiobacillus thiooxidans]|uniref:diguanylate cyclase n=1 Tax=Acidithiobacillus thiooxidans TaxID=930 RepID=A0A1C2I1X4_ACITH|nr:GGDEF domain-containing protein [Acidithiobacillus thiooxidans]MBU2841398.1 GGDEF domain-containing protein [Acidithiobacillus thiooxidans]OCX70031.1 hypothetical protein A6O24_17110 [Acidithiobacillus thiooxidans]OCX70083.1 hypothetical protein A6P07_15320 [Acidithiobacillus thiooxidans]OCX78337.1 hypothetical protein A6O26_18245 [Acidithiobacillus thiooxidans]OCX84069.1 hypothetical protein A6M27_16745 [Acidithiobacillus thiooxidans]
MKALHFLWLKFWRSVQAEIGQFFLLAPGDFADFISSRKHTALFARYRARFILSRVRMAAAVFAVLTPLWMIVDFTTFPLKIAGSLAVARIISSIAFGALAFFCHCSPGARQARIAVGMLLAIPTAFFVFSRILLANQHFSALGQALVTGYAFLPFIVLTGLALFPLVLLETLLFSLPMLSAFMFSDLFHTQGILPGMKDISLFWLLLLITVMSSMASLSQLQLMKGLFQQSIQDPLTHLWNRRSGEQFLQLQMAQALRQKFPLTVVFLDLDNFKQVNDIFGHEAGDDVLLHAAEQTKAALRDSDAVIRWGGEEFVLVMPYTTAEWVSKRLDAIILSGTIQRPDGQHMTWSGGIAQWPQDDAGTWQALVKLADERMYRAKKEGKARIYAK